MAVESTHDQMALIRNIEKSGAAPPPMEEMEVDYRSY